MVKKAKYICIEGIDGVGKSTQCEKLTRFLKSLSYKVLSTKEPGSSHLPLTMKLREIFLSDEYDNQLTLMSRELISQACRNIHMEKLIRPALEEYDYIIQDRGILSGLSYGVAGGLDKSVLCNLNKLTIPDNLSYDLIIILHTDNIEESLKKAKSITSNESNIKDVIESRDLEYFMEVSDNFDKFSLFFKKVISINVLNKNENEVYNEIIRCLLQN